MAEERAVVTSTTMRRCGERSDNLVSWWARKRGFSPLPRSSCRARPELPGCPCSTRLPGISGFAFQQELAKIGIALPVIFLTGHADVPMSVRAMKAARVEFLTKLFHDQELLDAIQRGDRGDCARRRSGRTSPP